MEREQIKKFLKRHREKHALLGEGHTVNNLTGHKIILDTSKADTYACARC